MSCPTDIVTTAQLNQSIGAVMDKISKLENRLENKADQSQLSAIRSELSKFVTESGVEGIVALMLGSYATKDALSALKSSLNNSINTVRETVTNQVYRVQSQIQTVASRLSPIERQALQALSLSESANAQAINALADTNKAIADALDAQNKAQSAANKAIEANSKAIQGLNKAGAALSVATMAISLINTWVLAFATKAEISRLWTAHDAQTQDINQSFNTAINTIQRTKADLENQIDNTENRLGRNIESTQRQLRNEINSTENSLSNRINTVNQNQTSANRSLENRLSNDIESSRNAVLNRVSIVETTVNNKIEDTENTLTNQIQKTRSDLNNEIKQTKNQIKETEQRLDNKIQQAKNEIQETKKQINKDILAVKLDLYQQGINPLRNLVDESKKRLQNEINTITNWRNSTTNQVNQQQQQITQQQTDINKNRKTFEEAKAESDKYWEDLRNGIRQNVKTLEQQKAESDAWWKSLRETKLGQDVTNRYVREVDQKVTNTSNKIPELVQQEVSRQTPKVVQQQLQQQGGSDVDLSPINNKLDTINNKIDNQSRDIDKVENDLARNLAITAGITTALTALPFIIDKLNNLPKPNISPCRFTPDPVSPLIKKDTDIIKAQNVATQAQVGVNIGISNTINTTTNAINTTTNTMSQRLFDFLDNTWTKFRTGFDRLYTNLGVDRALNVMNNILLLHNAAMLSNALFQTLGDTVDITLQAIGFNWTDQETGEKIEFSQFIGKSVKQFFQDILGTENYNTIVKTWASFSRIYQAGANMLYGIRSLINEAADLAETTYETLAKWMNVARNDGLVQENSYRDYPEDITPQSRYRNAIQKYTDNADQAETALDSIAMISSNVVSLKDELKENKENLDNWNKTIKEEGDKLDDLWGEDKEASDIKPSDTPTRDDFKSSLQ